MITIDFLADHPEAIPTLAKWFRTQWPEYYAGLTQAELERDFLTGAQRDHLPIRLVAFESGELAGTIILRADGREMLPEFQPELGGLYVAEAHQGRHVGTELVRAGMELARTQGYPTVFATTIAATGILQRLGWEFIQTVMHQDGPLALYRCTL